MKPDLTNPFSAPEQIKSNFNHQLVELALAKTPTGGNAKPFTWHWQGDVLHVAQDAVYDTHYLNRNHHAGWLTLGCLIASVQMAAQFQGHTTEVKVLESFVGAQITFVRGFPQEPNQQNFESLIKRQTYRGALVPSKAPQLDSLTESSLQHKKNVNTKAILASSLVLQLDFKKFLATCDNYIWLQRKAAISFFSEVRFFDKNLVAKGISSENLGISKIDQRLLYLFSFVPWLLAWVLRIPLLNHAFIKASKDSLRHAHFVLITATDLNSTGLVQAGEAAMDTWLQLESQGYVVQPYSMASLTLVDAATGNLPADTLPEFRKLFTSDGPKILKQQFNLKDSEKPVWLLRVGKK